MSGRRIAALIVVASVVMLMLISLLSGGGMTGWGGRALLDSGIVMPLVGALVIVAVAWLAASLPSPRRVAVVPVAGSTRPLDVLKERYARGELTREEYRRIRWELER